MALNLRVHVNNVHGSQMAAKITGRFDIDGREFRFTAIAFGRIGGQNVGAKLSKSTVAGLKKLGHDPDEVILELQNRLLEGDMTVPEGLRKESFADG